MASLCTRYRYQVSYYFVLLVPGYGANGRKDTFDILLPRRFHIFCEPGGGAVAGGDGWAVAQESIYIALERGEWPPFVGGPKRGWPPSGRP